MLWVAHMLFLCFIGEMEKLTSCSETSHEGENKESDDLGAGLWLKFESKLYSHTGKSDFYLSHLSEAEGSTGDRCWTRTSPFLWLDSQTLAGSIMLITQTQHIIWGCFLWSIIHFLNNIWDESQYHNHHIQIPGFTSTEPYTFTSLPLRQIIDYSTDGFSAILNRSLYCVWPTWAMSINWTHLWNLCAVWHLVCVSPSPASHEL